MNDEERARALLEKCRAPIGRHAVRGEITVTYDDAIALIAGQLRAVREPLERQVGDLIAGANVLLDRAEKAEVEIARLTEERDAIAEELASNHACNLFTWKEQAQAAQATVAALRAVVSWVRENLRPIWDGHTGIISPNQTAIEKLDHALTDSSSLATAHDQAVRAAARAEMREEAAKRIETWDTEHSLDMLADAIRRLP